jgi:glycine hydroxymethyltransferase
VALKEASQPEFAEYSKQVVSNARALGSGLEKRGHKLATGGTDNHLLLWDVRPLGLTGAKVDMVLERVSITANKNSLPGDQSAINPGGVRLGTPALTTRGLKEEDFDRVAELLDEGCKIAVKAQSGEVSRKTKKVLLKDFQHVLEKNEEIKSKMDALRQDVETFATPFYMPG